MVGSILQFRLSCAVHHPQYQQLSAAIVALSVWHQGSHTLDGDQVPASESSLQKAWPDFKPAAHLWAAWCVWEEKHQEKVFLHDPRRLPEFLALGDSFLREAECHEILSADENMEDARGSDLARRECVD